MENTTEFEDDVKNAINVLNNGGTILYPTDTIWGLGCSADNDAAIERIFEIKRRPKVKSLIVLLAEAKDILQYAATPHPDIISIVESFDGPTTVIYENALNIAENAIHETGSIAIRVTKDPFCKALIKRLKKPLISTSANISGEQSAPTFNLISDEIKSGVDYIVAYRQNDMTVKPASRIVRINDDGSLNVIRG